MLWLGLTAAGCIDIGDIASSNSQNDDSSGDASSSSAAEPANSTSSGTETPDIGSTSDPGATTGDGSTSAGESTSTGTTAGTTGDVAECGDGVLDESEECELDSEHCVNCSRDRHVFVSSQTYYAAAITGIAGGDQHCYELASAAGLDNPSRYRVWLSDSQAEARDHAQLSETSRYILPGAEEIVVAMGTEFLADQPTLIHSIDRDEHGEFVDDYAWTGTNPGGTRRSLHCLDWKTEDGDENGYFGSTSAVDASWTLSSVGFNPIGCNLPLRIYCFEAK